MGGQYKPVFVGGQINRSVFWIADTAAACSVMSQVYKVWNADRSVKKLVKAANLQELKEHGKKKLNYSENDHVTIVSEIDGTVIEDEDYFRSLPTLHRFILLRDREKWKQGMGREFYNNEQPGDEIDSSLQSSSITDVLLMLRQDITKLVTLSNDELQTVLKLEQQQLANCLNIPVNEAARIQDKCQQYLDEVQDAAEAMDLLRLIKNKDAGFPSGSQSSYNDKYQEGSTRTEDEPDSKRPKC